MAYWFAYYGPECIVCKILWYVAFLHGIVKWGIWIGCSTMNEYASVCKQNKMISLIDSNDYIISLQNFQISRRTTDCHTLLAHSSTLAGISKQRSSLILAHVILTGKTAAYQAVSTGWKCACLVTTEGCYWSKHYPVTDWLTKCINKNILNQLNFVIVAKMCLYLTVHLFTVIYVMSSYLDMFIFMIF